MRKIAKQCLSVFLILGMMLTCVLPASAYTAPQDAQDSLKDGYSSQQGRYAVYPVPQSEEYTGGEFSLDQEVSVVCGEEVDSCTRDFLEEILTTYGRTGKETEEPASEGSQIVLGVWGSGSAADLWAREHLTVQKEALFSQTDAYLLQAKEGTIAILGRDTEAVYYGLATLQMMFSSFGGERFLNVQIEDFASMEVRGFIEGFYGGWNEEGRESLMRFARDFKMNTYIYASKTDPYHKNDTLYPEDQIDGIRRLVEVGKETRVAYTWSVHISYFFNRLSGLTVGSEDYEEAFQENYEKLVKKLTQLYDAGVRKFDVLNDDFGSGTHSEVVRLLNKLDTEFIQPKGCEQLTYCPQGYNESWSTAGELEALKSLNSTITIYWTGRDVNAPITQETVDFLRERTGHDPVFWLNYPVNEHGASGVYLGDISHYARNDVTGLAGAVSNPSRFTESNKVGLFQLAALFWNNHGYQEQAEEIWEEAFSYLQPEVRDAYLTIAKNVANCPNSTRVPEGFPESEYLKETLDAVETKMNAGEALAQDSDVQILLEEFVRMVQAVETFRGECANENLKEELAPWLNSLTDIATAGEAALKSLIALEEEEVELAWKELAIAGKAMETQDTYPTHQGSDKMALAGSKYLAPFVSRAVTAVKNRLTPYLNPNSTDFTPSFYGKMGGIAVGDLANTAKMFDQDDTTYAGFQTVQKEGDYFGVDLGRVLWVHSIEILQGKTDTDHDYFHNGCLEYSRDGQEWKTIAANVDSHKLGIQDISIQARYVRLRLTKEGTASKPDYWTFIREFSINESAQGAFGVYTSLEELQASPVTLEDKTYSLENLRDVCLEPQDYLGIKLGELSDLEGVECRISENTGAVVQYSENGVIWEEAGELMQGRRARYVRLYNGTGEPVSFDLEALRVTVASISIHPQVTESSFPGLKEGAWENLFDGNTATYAWTDTPQRAGQYILVDLGATAPVYDLRITTEDGNPRFYNAKIQVSTDRESWEDIAEVVDGGGDAVRDNIFYRITKDLGGKQVRYVKILITGDSGYYLKLCDIEINRTRESGSSVLSGSLTGDLERMIDGNISTVYTAERPSDGTDYVTYTLTEDTKLTAVTILQDATQITGAQVTAKLYDGSRITEENLGALQAGSTTFPLDGKRDVLSLKIIWPKDAIPTVYEIFAVSDKKDSGTGEETDFSGEKQVYKLSREQFSSITVPFGTSLAEVPLPEEIQITYQDGSTENTGLFWQGEYQPDRAGVYRLKGYPLMPEGACNYGGLYADIEVTVEEAEADRYPDMENGNLAENCPVTESGAGLHPVEKAVDGDLETRWEGNAIKGDAAPQATSWIQADLGPKKIQADRVEVRFYLKTFGTDYDLQTSDNGTDWTTIQTITRENGDTRDPVDEITLEEPITQRYVRLFFRSMNTAAAGHAVGIRELEILGSRRSEETPEPTRYTLTFRGGEGAAGADPEEIRAEAGTGVTLPENPYEKEGYTFLGWSDGEKLYQPGDTYVIPESDTELTAKWEETRQEETDPPTPEEPKPPTEEEPKPPAEEKPKPPSQEKPDLAAPGQPQKLKASAEKAKSLKLSWEKVKGAEGYMISRYDRGKKQWKDIKTTTAATVLIRGLKPASVYQFRVRAFTESQGIRKEGAPGKALKAATAPVKTKLKAKKAGAARVKLTWNRKAKADGFEIFMKTGKGKYKKISAKGKKAISMTKGGMKKGKKYTFRLRSYKKAGKRKSYSVYSYANLKL